VDRGNRVKLLIVGCGSVGKRHLGNFKTIGVDDIGAVDKRSDRLKEVQEKFSVKKVYSDLDAALNEKYDAAVVATPPSLHIPIATKLAENKCHLLIEKPISDNLDGIETLLKVVRDNKLILLVGYTYRFWPPLIKVEELLKKKILGRVYSVRIEFSEYLPDWHPWEDYRTFYMAKKELGGGAILDESHTIDFARWFFGEIKEISCINDKISTLEISSDDIAEMLVRFKSGVVGNIHLDIFGRSHRKNLEIICEKGNIYWDFYQNKVEIYYGDDKRWEIYPYNCERNLMFLEEAKHFLQCVRNGTPPKISGEDGVKTLKCVLAAIESSKTKKVIKMV